ASLEPAEEAPSATELANLGLQLAPVTGAARAEYDIPESVQGVLIAGVMPDGPAAAEGLGAGQVIVEVGQEPVATPEDVLREVERVKGEGKNAVLLLVHTAGDLRFVPVSFPEE
ncbi:MAG: PDZ domain-containing protein, partial [Pseudomonadota bacterium]